MGIEASDVMQYVIIKIVKCVHNMDVQHVMMDISSVMKNIV